MLILYFIVVLSVTHCLNLLQQHNHWVQSKRHRLWFSTKTCSCYSTKNYVDSLILSSNWIWLRWETNTLKCVWCSTKTTFNVNVSQRSQIQFEDEDHAVYMSFRWVTTTLSLLRTTACDALIVPSDNGHICVTELHPRQQPGPVCGGDLPGHAAQYPYTNAPVTRAGVVIHLEIHLETQSEFSQI